MIVRHNSSLQLHVCASSYLIYIYIYIYCAILYNSRWMAESENETRMTPNYTFVGDNIDKNVTPRYMRVDKQVESIHAWHSYATLDRYNAADASKNVTLQKIDAVATDVFLPSASDTDALRKNFIILCSRVLVNKLSCLKSFKSCVPEHIEHALSVEMARRSTVVSST